MKKENKMLYHLDSYISWEEHSSLTDLSSYSEDVLPQVIKNKLKYMQNINKSKKKAKKKKPCNTSIANKENVKKSIIENPLFKCDICSKQFSKKSTLGAHTKLHEINKTFGCKVNTKEFAQNTHLKKKRNSDSKRKCCNSCGEVFKCYIDLQKHPCKAKEKQSCTSNHLKEVTSSPNKIKSFKCEYCSKEYHRKYHLDKHKESMHEKKDYYCNVCDRKLSGGVKWRKHLREVHNLYYQGGSKLS